MGSLTNDQLRKLGNFDASSIDNLTADLQAGEAIDALSSDAALSLTRIITELAVTGTDAYTLAAPTFANQRKIVRCVLAASTPVATLTVSSPDDTTGFVCAATFVFDAVGQEIEFQATSALKWRCIRKKRAGVLATITAGATVLTGRSMSKVYSIAVDGTDAGTGTGGLPNGSAVGERCNIACELAANTPVGSLTGAYSGVFGTAYTVLGAIGAVGSTTTMGDFAELEWNGSAWQVVNMSGCTLS